MLYSRTCCFPILSNSTRLLFFWSFSQKAWDFIILLCRVLPQPCPRPQCQAVEKNREKKSWGLAPSSWNHSSAEPRGTFSPSRVLVLQAPVAAGCSCHLGAVAWENGEEAPALWVSGVFFPAPWARATGHLLALSLAVPNACWQCVEFRLGAYWRKKSW